MGTIRSRLTKKVGPIRSTLSWGSKRGITASSSYGEKGMRTTLSANQKTGKMFLTQSQKLGKNTWWVHRETLNKTPRRRYTESDLSPIVRIILAIVTVVVVLWYRNN